MRCSRRVIEILMDSDFECDRDYNRIPVQSPLIQLLQNSLHSVGAVPRANPPEELHATGTKRTCVGSPPHDIFFPKRKKRSNKTPAGTSTPLGTVRFFTCFFFLIFVGSSLLVFVLGFFRRHFRFFLL